MVKVMLIGLSLSGCIRDIIAGKVDLSEVAYIVAGTNCPTSDTFDEAIRSYDDIWWKNSPYSARLIARSLWREGKIIQPKMYGARPLFHGGYIWTQQFKPFEA